MDPDENLASVTMRLSENSLREVATLMVLLRNDMSPALAVDINNANLTIADESLASATPEQTKELIGLLRGDLRAIEELRSRVAADISFTIADALYPVILGIPKDSGTERAENNGSPSEKPLILRLDEIEASLKPISLPDLDNVELKEDDVFFADTFVGDEQETVPASWATTVPDAETYIEAEDRKSTARPEPQYLDALVVEVVPTVKMESTGAVADAIMRDTGLLLDDDASTMFTESMPKYKTFMAEVVSDEEIDSAFGEAKAVKNLSDEEFDQEEPNLAVIALLRTLDVVFFVLEKGFTVVLPATIQYTVTATRRYREVQRSGEGNKGWELLRWSADAKGRY